MKNIVCRKTGLLLIACTCLLPLTALTNPWSDSTVLPANTLKSFINSRDTASTNSTLPESTADGDIEQILLNETQASLTTVADTRALFHYLKSTRLKKASRDRRLSYKLYFGLAKHFIRMKLYPLAMQCYYQTLVLTDTTGGQGALVEPAAPAYGTNTDTIDDAPGTMDSLKRYAPALHYPFDALVELAEQHSGSADQTNSASFTAGSIINVFDDGKSASSYAVVLHVKQPKPGSRRSFTGINNVGHFFITLLKYNEDAGVVSRSFGFYPQKQDFFSATPLHPVSAAVFKNDARHEWDEAIGKFISRKRFEKIIRLIAHYNNRAYHLNKNNCTDFGLLAACIAGVHIEKTTGTWPLGKGNNPANTGQSILEGKITNTDTGNTRGLFICNNFTDH